MWRWHHPYGRKQRRTREPLESEREWKSWLKTQLSKIKVYGIWPITSWQIDGETMETVRDFILGGSKITADGDCSHEIKRHLLLGRKAMTNLDSILKSKDIILQTKVHLVKAMLFPVVMYGCESWTIKCWGPAWGTPPMAKVMRKEARHKQRRDWASGVPLEIFEHLPP